MKFTEFLLSRLTVLERATRGYGNCISERSLYGALSDHGMAPDDFAVLLEWGLLHELLRAHETPEGRRFIVDRNALVALRRRANGEGSDSPVGCGDGEPPARNTDNGTLRN